MAEKQDIRQNIKTLYQMIQIRIMNPKLSEEERKDFISKMEELLKQLPPI